MKYLFQFIGLAMVVLILVCSVLFYVEKVGLLQGEFADYIHVMRELWLQAKNISITFFQTSGIADDAADLLDQSADMLRGTESPVPTATATPEQPGLLITPTPAAQPTEIVLPALTPQPITMTPQLIVINTPTP